MRKHSKTQRSLGRWLERKYAVPEFGGALLTVLSIFFFAAATNTLAGWLYVISGVNFALLLVAYILPARTMKELKIQRSPIQPVSAGESISIELALTNHGKSDKGLMQVYDSLPQGIADQAHTPQVIDQLLAGAISRWNYPLDTKKRGVFEFQAVQIVTANPFGLFRSRRSLFPNQPQRAIVYPQVLTLSQCPLIDQIGRDDSPKVYSQNLVNSNANEGLTKALRPYRWGDPLRLIHWRTSAKFGELRVRELEITLGGQDLVIALDTNPGWSESEFEEAVVAAASLYFYAQGLNLNVKLWTVTMDLVQGKNLVLETLAAVNIDASTQPLDLPDLPLVWITHQDQTIRDLPIGSRWLLWTDHPPELMPIPGLVIGKTLEDIGYAQLRSQLQTQPLKIK
jgi:uncharacterized protein (DUF58 family)